MEVYTNSMSFVICDIKILNYSELSVYIVFI